MPSQHPPCIKTTDTYIVYLGFSTLSLSLCSFCYVYIYTHTYIRILSAFSLPGIFIISDFFILWQEKNPTKMWQNKKETAESNPMNQRETKPKNVSSILLYCRSIEMHFCGLCVDHLYMCVCDAQPISTQAA